MGQKRREPGDPLRVLDSFAVQLRNLAAVERHARQVLDQLEPRYPELTAELRSRMEVAAVEQLLDPLNALRTAVERSEQERGQR